MKNETNKGSQKNKASDFCICDHVEKNYYSLLLPLPPTPKKHYHYSKH